MRRFSQKTALVTLNEINITPLLDLAFVLLIIFVIISPSIKSAENHGMELNLPQGGGAMQKVNKSDIRVVEVDQHGRCMLDAARMTPDQIERELVKTFKSNPKLVVKIRLDQNGFNKDSLDIVNRCVKNGITKLSFATQPKAGR